MQVPHSASAATGTVHTHLPELHKHGRRLCEPRHLRALHERPHVLVRPVGTLCGPYVRVDQRVVSQTPKIVARLAAGLEVCDVLEGALCGAQPARVDRENVLRAHVSERAAFEARGVDLDKRDGLWRLDAADLAICIGVGALWPDASGGTPSTAVLIYARTCTRRQRGMRVFRFNDCGREQNEA